MSISKLPLPREASHSSKKEFAGVLENIYWIVVSFERHTNNPALAELKKILIEMKGREFSFGPDNDMKREPLELMAVGLMPIFEGLVSKNKPLFEKRFKLIDWKMAFGIPDPEVGVVITNASDEDSGGSTAPESLSITEDPPK